MNTTLTRDFKRLGFLFTGIYILAATLLVFILLYAYHAQQTRLARSFALASRHSLLLRDLRQTVNSLKPALTEGFTAISLTTSDGEVIFTIPSNSVLNEVTGILDLRIPIAMTTETDKPSAPALATVVFYYNIRIVFLGTIGAAALLFGIFVYLFRRSKSQVEERHQIMIEKRRSETAHEIAKQVSHDIRSPLSALNMVVSTLDSLPEDRHQIIKHATQRINDIANSLLRPQTQNPTVPSASTIQENLTNSKPARNIKPTMLLSIVDSIVSEKRIQYSFRADIEFQADLSKGFGVFANIDPTELARALSNLMNNSVEALQSGGKVTAHLRKFGKTSAIMIQDNGSGISLEVLQRLGKKGITHGKSGTESGSGLGVYHAREMTEAAGGKLQIQSKIGEGTLISINLPSCPPPDWFCEKISLRFGSLVVSVDDNLAVHELWKERFRSTSIESGGRTIEHLTFTSLDEFKRWYQSNSVSKDASKTMLVLIDQEFLGQRSSGIETIEQLNLGSSAILVTSNFEEADLQSRIIAAQAKLLPKGLAHIVPIESNDGIQAYSPLVHLQSATGR